MKFSPMTVAILYLINLRNQHCTGKSRNSEILARARMFLNPVLPQTLREQRDTELTKADEDMYGDYGFVAADLLCKAYDNQPAECARNGCFYCCSDQLCHASSNSAPDCISTSCPCDNVCGCTERKCYAVADGQTCSTKDVCSSIAKLPCTRKRDFYVIRGVLCKSDVTEGNCTFDTPLLALNLGGGTFTDLNDIVYSNCTDANQLAVFKVRWGTYKHAMVINVPPADRPLYLDSWWLCCGAVGGNYSQSCETWKTQVPSDGLYELVVKTLECCHKKRQFDILLNGVIILAEFGPRQYVERFEKLDIVIQFKITGSISKLSVDGYPSSVITNNTIAVSFCCGRYCDGTHPEPQISAFFVRKFHKEELPQARISGRRLEESTTTERSKIREIQHGDEHQRKIKPRRKIDLSRRRWQ